MSFYLCRFYSLRKNIKPESVYVVTWEWQQMRHGTKLQVSAAHSVVLFWRNCCDRRFNGSYLFFLFSRFSFQSLGGIWCKLLMIVVYIRLAWGSRHFYDLKTQALLGKGSAPTCARRTAFASLLISFNRLVFRCLPPILNKTLCLSSYSRLQLIPVKICIYMYERLC